MATNNCGTLRSIDLSNIKVALQEYRYETEKNIKDAANELKQLNEE